MTGRVWFITGASRGLGREWATAALEAGESVAATARDRETVQSLVDQFGDRVLPLRLDVTDRAAVFEAVHAAHDRFGRLDVIVNNAGYGQFGMLEELSEQEARDQIETNLFGALWVTQAVLPYLRSQHSGHIIQVSSIAGITAFHNVGIYSASKWALEGMSQSLAKEIADFGIHVTLIEPGGYSTDWGGSSARRATALPAYDAFRAAAQASTSGRLMSIGVPAATRNAILQVVDSDEPPLRVFFGDGPLALARQDYESRLTMWAQWESMSIAAHGSPADAAS